MISPQVDTILKKSNDFQKYYEMTYRNEEKHHDVGNTIIKGTSMKKTS